MDTNSTITWILVGVVVIIFLIALYYISQLGKRKSKTIVTNEPVVKAAAIVAPKVEIPDVSLKPVVKAAAIEAPKITDAVQPAPEYQTKSTTVQINTKQMEKEKTARAQTTSQGPKKSKEPVIRRGRGKNIVDIEGVGPTNAEKLNSINIFTTSDMLESGATPQGRKEISDKTSISPKLILEWVNLSDLFRIKGVGEEYSDLLEEAGVDTVVELSRRNASNLHAKILEINETKKLVRRPPSLASIESWIQEAKTLPRIIEY
jgi:predicted flap endonuclease-1-like 5' DNA nuclease